MIRLLHRPNSKRRLTHLLPRFPPCPSRLRRCNLLPQQFPRASVSCEWELSTELPAPSRSFVQRAFGGLLLATGLYKHWVSPARLRRVGLALFKLAIMAQTSATGKHNYLAAGLGETGKDVHCRRGAPVALSGGNSPGICSPHRVLRNHSGTRTPPGSFLFGTRPGRPVTGCFGNRAQPDKGLAFGMRGKRNDGGASTCQRTWRSG